MDALGKEALGRDFLDLMSIVFGTVALTLGALLIAVFVGWRWGARKALEEMNGLPLGGLWAVAIRIVCPLATAGVLTVTQDNVVEGYRDSLHQEVPSAVAKVLE